MSQRARSARQMLQILQGAKKKLQKATDAKSEEKIDGWIKSINTHLKKNRHLVPDIHLLLTSGVLDLDDNSNQPAGEEDFSDWYNFVHKVPRQWVLMTVLNLVDERFAEEAFVRKLMKVDPDAPIKILEYGCSVKRGDPFGPSPRQEWREAYVERLQRQDVLSSLEMGKDGSIDWSVTGVFVFRPEYDPESGVEPGDHYFKKVAIGTKFEVDLKTFKNVITAEWLLEKNWDIHGAHIVSPGGEHRLSCLGFFGTRADVAEYISPMYRFVESSRKRGAAKKEEQDDDEQGDKKRVKRPFVSVSAAPAKQEVVKEEKVSKQSGVVDCKPPSAPPSRRIRTKSCVH